MRAGRRQHLVEFNRRSAEADEYGNVTGEFVPLFTVWGNVRETTGKERVAAGSVENTRTATIRVRSCVETRGLTAGDQAVARGAKWNILGIANADDQGVDLDILGQTGGAQ